MSRLRVYEILLIIDPRLTEEEVSHLLTRVQESAKEIGALVRGVDNWGKRRLAYEIRKQREGTYVVLELMADAAILKELERQLKLNENVLRFLSSRVATRKRAQPAKAPEAVEEVG